MSTPIQQIRELRALHEEGLLSAHEFAQRKNGILDSVFRLSTNVQDKSSENAELTPRPNQQKKQIDSKPNTTDLGYLIGQHLLGNGKEYQLQTLIGQGGMSQVWKVHDLSTEAELGYSEALALKILSPELSQSTLHRRLLIEEASMVRKLAHENIVRVYDWGRDPATGSVFIVMEYLEGQDIEQYLRQQLARATPEQRGLSLQHALKILKPISNALHYVWKKQGLVHRDLKPSNLFLCKNGQIKLLDFGIAARVASSSSPPYSTEHTVHSSLLPLAGTSGYRAPEVQHSDDKNIEDSTQNASADVYALAVMLYQMLEGILPFGETRYRYHQANKPKLLNQAQWGILQRALSWKPTERPSHPFGFLRDLEQAGATPALATPINDTERRAIQRQQQKLVEQQRRQHASQALLYLQAKVCDSKPKAAMQNKSSNWEQSLRYLKTVSRNVNDLV